jgi:hypothetical protein
MSDDNDDVTAAFVGAGFGAVSFFRGFRVLRNKRLIENTPTSKCRSIAMGMVEVAGRATGQQTMPSLIGRLPCYCSHILIERYERRGKSSRWVNVHERQDGIPFYIEDNTGRVLVDPAGAELDIPPELEHSEGTTKALLGMTLARFRETGRAASDIPSLFYSYCAANGVSSMGQMRFTERNLGPGDPAFVLGSAEERRGVQDEHERIVIRKGKHHPWFFIAESSEKDLLKKLGRSTLLHIYGGAALCLACLAYLLNKFGLWE